MVELNEKCTFRGQEEYCFYKVNPDSYRLTSNRDGEVICTYEVKGDNIEVSKMDTANTYFFRDEAIKKGIQEINNKK